MKAVILAAGYGKRMGKLAESLPKPLIPIANKPILQHLIESLNKSGVKNFVIAVGHLKDQIISFLTTFQKNGIELTIKNAKDFKKGPIYSFYACRDEIKDEDFILTPADLLIDPSFLLEIFQKSKEQKIMLAFDDGQINSHHTTIYLSKNNKIRNVLGITSNVIGGESVVKLLLPLLICRVNIQSYIEMSLNLKHKRVIDAIELYLQQKNVATAYKIQNRYWFELDTISDILRANEFFLNLRIGKDQTIINSKEPISRNISIKNPILIGKNCQIENNCVLGPNVSIGNNTHIGKNVKIQNAIICPSSEIPKNTKLENAIFFRLKYNIDS
ncbi:MAG: NDP-sugar synthase [Candidatus Helarchaeota archaeon]|nr:NDP-sugar synthase [Candidatus Helarchaeota archaeon]